MEETTDRLAAYFDAQRLDAPQGTTRREIAYLRIRRAIREGELAAGDPLKETVLSDLLGISRTPVREALQLLVQEGLADGDSNRPIVVATITLQDVLDVVHIRTLLEPELTRLAAEHISPKQLAALEAAMTAMEAAAERDDLASWTEADTRFHGIVREACPNQLLGETVVALRNRVHSMANVDTQTNAERLHACTCEHREVVDAIHAKDGDAARSAVRAHLEALTDSLLRRIAYR